jgi:putative membrane protein
MKKVLAGLLICSAMTCFVACGNGSDKDSKDVAKEENNQKFDSTNIEGDTKFAVALADGGMMEIESSKLALTNATAANVKDFAKMMVSDHTGAAAELKDAAARKNISLPSVLSDDKQKKFNDLAAKKGTDFDKAYVDLMVSEHEEAVKALQDESEKGNDPDLKAWAAGKLPVIQKHLDVIKSIKDAKK